MSALGRELIVSIPDIEGFNLKKGALKVAEAYNEPSQAVDAQPL
jgi:hypothetical protein